ncbi:hypothetical protein SAMN04488523_10745 [Sulfitobacter brevis]|uniref:Uncharacterized protein n=1 Tax=Sulfitobacter brevis TaxID=74348 RepID=A0A1I2ACH0_9RHOB|nr:hypothetical protein SAMN04488523_10745 [Sulfitobacter brevis]
MNVREKKGICAGSGTGWIALKHYLKAHHPHHSTPYPSLVFENSHSQPVGNQRWFFLAFNFDGQTVLAQ